jgi:two-component system LytT family response regulator
VALRPPTLPPVPYGGELRRFIGGHVLVGVAAYATIVAVITAIEERAARRKRELDTARLEADLAQAQLRALQMQLQPHFLFNTLHGIAMLTDSDPAGAETMAVKLAELLRATLRLRDVPEVALRTELELLRAYLEIEELRFGDRLSVTFAVPEDLLDVPVPSFLLQPIVENAVRHGVAPRVENGRITIGATRDGSALVLSVEDDGPGFDTDPFAVAGVGLSATARPSCAALWRGWIHSVRGAECRRARGAGRDQSSSRRITCALMQTELRVLIADDEPAALNGLARRLAATPGVLVVATCVNGIEALERIRATRPDAAFLDVAMPGLSGLDVVRALAPAARPHIVFVTAYERFAIQAFDLYAVDYLLKPFARERLAATVARLRDRRQDRAPANHSLDDFLSASADNLVVKDGETILVIPAHEIDWCSAEDNYVRIHAGPKRHLVRMTMRRLEEQLPRATFARIHRSAIVNVERVRECAPLGGGEYRVTLVNGVRLVVSRTYRAAMLNRLQGR